MHQLQSFERVPPVDRLGRNPVDFVARFGGGFRERCFNLPAQGRVSSSPLELLNPWLNP